MLTVMFLFSLFDRKLREYGPIFVERNEATMRRLLVDAISGADSMLKKYPDDFDLYQVGVYDTELGRINGEEVPRLVDNCKTILEVPDGS